MNQRRFVVDVGEGRDYLALGARVERLVHPSTVASKNLGVSLAVMAPGERIKRHRHDYEEAYFVLDGQGTMYLEGVGELELVPGRSVYIPPNTIHGQVNVSDGDLRILCSLSPPPPETGTSEMAE